MDLDAIFSLMDRAEKSSFDKIEIEFQDLKLRLERGGEQVIPGQQPVPSVKSLPEKPVEVDDAELVRSPISGVFYVAKEPGAEPFVTEGRYVNKGDTVCIIEAMKTMNEIVAPRAGVIEAVLVKDKQTVSAGEALFRLTGDK
jgi:acetyl-CoA carboxylase biotin carboxyl carrier protein